MFQIIFVRSATTYFFIKFCCTNKLLFQWFNNINQRNTIKLILLHISNATDESKTTAGSNATDDFKQTLTDTSNIFSCTNSLSTYAPVASTSTVDVEDSDEEIGCSQLDELFDERLIELIMRQTDVTRQQAIRHYILYKKQVCLIYKYNYNNI